MDEIFWIYENWKNNGRRARIHRLGCTYCQIPDGQEKPKSSVGSAWHGPFTDLETTISEANKLHSKVSFCKMCLRDLPKK